MFFVRALVGIMTFFVSGIALDLAWVPIVLLFAFHDSGGINANCGKVEGLVSLASYIRIRIFFKRAT